ncbi:MAG: hypothetical protein OER82_01260 [Nitrosopumilus sp.]|nr:hypothetical protein [Nitrosopumilus sp.]
MDYSNLDLDYEKGKISQKGPLSTLIGSIEQKRLAQSHQVFFFMKDDKIYQISYASTPETFSDNFSTTTKIIGSFEFESKVSKSVEVSDWIRTMPNGG